MASSFFLRPLARREPFDPLLDDLFNATDLWALPAWRPARVAAETASAARARMDVIDKGAKYEIKVDLPGVRKEDIEVSIEGNRISISAKAKEEKEAKEGGTVLHLERFSAGYARSFDLPVEVSDAGSDAVYENGVLTLTLPKRASATTKRLEIH